MKRRRQSPPSIRLIVARTSQVDKQIDALHKQRVASQRKIDGLYDEIESGHVVTADVAPRLPKVNSEIDDLPASIL